MSNPRLLRTLYKSFLTKAKKLPRERLHLRSAVQPRLWGHAGYIPRGMESRVLLSNVLPRYLLVRIGVISGDRQKKDRNPTLASHSIKKDYFSEAAFETKLSHVDESLQSMFDADGISFSSDELIDFIRFAFRQDPNKLANKSEHTDDMSVDGAAKNKLPIEYAFASLRLLNTQIALSKLTSVANTNGICVEATTVQITPELARENQINIKMPPDSGFCFAYNIRIENTSDRPVQLLERQWIIKDGPADEKKLPKNSGVVGHTPVLQPGQVFKYGSGSFLSHEKGSMSGSFTMKYVANIDEVKKEKDKTTTKAKEDKKIKDSSKQKNVGHRIEQFQAAVAPFAFAGEKCSWEL